MLSALDLLADCTFQRAKRWHYVSLAFIGAGAMLSGVWWGLLFVGLLMAHYSHRRCMRAYDEGEALLLQRIDNLRRECGVDPGERP